MANEPQRMRYFEEHTRDSEGNILFTTIKSRVVEIGPLRQFYMTTGQLSVAASPKPKEREEVPEVKRVQFVQKLDDIPDMDDSEEEEWDMVYERGAKLRSAENGAKTSFFRRLV